MKTIKIRKQIKRIGIKKIEKVLKEGGFLKAGGFTLTFDKITHDRGMAHHIKPKGMFLVSSWAILSKWTDILDALDSFSHKIQSRTKVTLMKKQAEFIQA